MLSDVDVFFLFCSGCTCSYRVKCGHRAMCRNFFFSKALCITVCLEMTKNHFAIWRICSYLKTSANRTILIIYDEGVLS